MYTNKPNKTAKYIHINCTMYMDCCSSFSAPSCTSSYFFAWDVPLALSQLVDSHCILPGKETQTVLLEKYELLIPASVHCTG